MAVAGVVWLFVGKAEALSNEPKKTEGHKKNLS